MKERTSEWFVYYGIDGLIEDIKLNTKDEQPHKFKEKMIKKLKQNVFIDDDMLLLEYLKGKVKGVDLLYFDRSVTLEGLR